MSVCLDFNSGPKLPRPYYEGVNLILNEKGAFTPFRKYLLTFP